MIIAGKLNSLEEWFRKAPPKNGINHWKDGHSAKEFAKLWFRKDKNKAEVPDELLILIRKQFPDIIIKFGIPEHITKIDTFPGGQRNHDLCLFGSIGYGDVIICIEAKATESLGKTIEQKLKVVKNKKLSNLPKRIDNLSKAIFNSIPKNSSDLNKLRYQLLTGLYGTLIEGFLQEAKNAMFIVHQICTNLVKKNIEKNTLKDIQDFLRFIPDVNLQQFKKGKPIGPIDYLVPNEYRNKEKLSLYFGYVKTDLWN